MNQIRMLRFPKKRYTRADVILPEGYSVVTHTDELVPQWLEICDSLNGGSRDIAKFENAVLKNPDISPERIFYITDPEGKYVATAIARWWSEEKHGGLHMVETRPEYRGLGLGRAICTVAVAALDELGTVRDRLSTDEFRIPAIKIYLSLGFVPWLYEDDMYDRWVGVMKGLGYSEYDMANLEGNSVQLYKF